MTVTPKDFIGTKSLAKKKPEEAAAEAEKAKTLRKRISKPVGKSTRK
ncbi:MAG: hypothetical protein MZV70_67155 [Desulfobacterales bacterium]|nr:hypothetical protein [Desulfobacterales bacterium]